MNRLEKPSPSKTVAKFSDPNWTAAGDRRACVPLARLETLWFNTGTLCNIECLNCYILSSPKNNALVYLTAADVTTYLDEIARDNWTVREIGFTGGEPFMNPAMIAMAEAALSRGFEVLILTNAMRPMMRPKVQMGLKQLAETYGEKLTLRVSLDHYSEENHDRERGVGTFARTLDGMRWLRDNRVRMTVAGRTIWGECDAVGRSGYAELFARESFGIDASNPGDCVLFPEMDGGTEVPEITEACWGILGKQPTDVMCASSRM
ncbi:MAG: radical SAM protein, partial [Pseudomonadota bacterium]